MKSLILLTIATLASISMAQSTDPSQKILADLVGIHGEGSRIEGKDSKGRACTVFVGMGYDSTLVQIQNDNSYSFSKLIPLELSSEQKLELNGNAVIYSESSREEVLKLHVENGSVVMATVSGNNGLYSCNAN